ncbi:hypothetical protein [Streptomyces sp. NPDC005955]|uniref:hypothetical protein n=1 Tax=Streptomyces sp. NPDC005955 TaxID=3364738 RepID=UPI0036B9E5B6
MPNDDARGPGTPDEQETPHGREPRDGREPRVGRDERDGQRLVRRSPALFTAPIVLLVVLALVLVWEVVRSNVTGELATQWPWRLRLMDMNPLGSLIAVAVAAVLTRTQYALAVRPALGWRSDWRPGSFGSEEETWQVGILNGGRQQAVVEAVDYRITLADGTVSDWLPHAGVLEFLTGARFAKDVDFALPRYGAGFPLIPSGAYDTVAAGEFTDRFVHEVEELAMRVRVLDGAGDCHERVMNLLKGAR